MLETVLHSDSFSITTENCTFISDGFSLRRGEIGVLYGLSSERIQDFLYLIGGLINQRGITRPAEPGKLVRETFLVPEEQLKTINFLGQPLYSYSSFERASYIGFIFENPELFIIGNTVIEEFKYSFAALRKEAPSPHVLERYNLYRKVDLKTESLSGGERHRLNCAAVFELSQNLVIADFSNSNLDADFTEKVVEWFQDLVILQQRAVFLTGIHAEKFTRVNPVKYFIQDGYIEVREPDGKLFPSEQEERRELQSKFKARDLGTNIVLEVKSLHLIGVTPPVSFQLKERELLVVKGPNGCGKTTLGKILTRRIQKGIGGTFWPKDNKPVMSLQYPERFFVMKSVHKELPNEELLNLCGIDPDLWGNHPRSLSRAQQKLLSIVMSLEWSEGYAILDEPTSGMDFLAKKRFVGILNKFSEKAIIIITHDTAISFEGLTRDWKDITSLG